MNSIAPEGRGGVGLGDGDATAAAVSVAGAAGATEAGCLHADKKTIVKSKKVNPVVLKRQVQPFGEIQARFRAASLLVQR